MSVSARTTANVQVPADISREAREAFRKELADLLKSRPGVLVIDCSQLTRASADHISTLCVALQTCDKQGVAVKLTAVSDGLARVLEVLELNRLFENDSDQITGVRRRAYRLAAEGVRRVYIDEFEGAVAEINNASESFLDFLRALRLPEIVTFELQTVFYEVAMNIAFHSDSASNERIVFTAEIDEQGIVMAFTDSGVPFDPTSHESDFEPRAAGKGRRKRGLGITLIKRLTDKLTYCRKHDSINVLTVEKHWG